MEKRGLLLEAFLNDYILLGDPATLFKLRERHRELESLKRLD